MSYTYTRNLSRTTADNLTKHQIMRLQCHAISELNQPLVATCTQALAGCSEALALVLEQIQADEKLVHAFLASIDEDPYRYGHSDETE